MNTSSSTENQAVPFQKSQEGIIASLYSNLSGRWELARRARHCVHCPMCPVRVHDVPPGTASQYRADYVRRANVADVLSAVTEYVTDQSQNNAVV